MEEVEEVEVEEEEVAAVEEEESAAVVEVEQARAVEVEESVEGVVTMDQSHLNQGLQFLIQVLHRLFHGLHHLIHGLHRLTDGLRSTHIHIITGLHILPLLGQITDLSMDHYHTTVMNLINLFPLSDLWNHLLFHN